MPYLDIPLRSLHAGAAWLRSGYTDPFHVKRYPATHPVGYSAGASKLDCREHFKRVVCFTEAG